MQDNTQEHWLLNSQDKSFFLPLLWLKRVQIPLKRLSGAAIMALCVAALFSTTAFAKEVSLVAGSFPVKARLQEGQAQTDANTGLLILAVDEDGPAAKAGVVRGDILAMANGVPLDSTPTLYDLVTSSHIGDEVVLVVQHGDESRTIPIILGQIGDRPYLGVQVADPPAVAGVSVPQIVEAAPAVGAPAESDQVVTATVSGEAAPTVAGLMVADVAPDGPAAQAGLVAGDLIVAIDGQPVATLDDLLNGLKGHTPGEVATLRIQKISEVARATLDIPVMLGAAPDDPTRAYLGVSLVEMTPAEMVEAPDASAIFTAPALPVAPLAPMPPDAIYSYGYGSAYASPYPPPFAVPVPAPYPGQACGAAVQPYIYAPGATITMQMLPPLPPMPAVSAAPFFVYQSGVNPQAYPSAVPGQAQANVIWYNAEPVSGSGAPVILPYPGEANANAASAVPGQKQIVIVREQSQPDWTITVPGVAVAEDVTTAIGGSSAAVPASPPVIAPLPAVSGQLDRWY